MLWITETPDFREILRCQRQAPQGREADIIQNQEPEKKEVKRRFQLWIKPSTLALADKLYAEDNCASRSEFIENAVIFYAGYLSTQNAHGYLPRTFLSTMKSIVSESTRRICNILFKLAVELAMLLNVIAATHKIDRATLERLRGECVREVKRTNGNFTLDDAVDWQEGEE